MPVKILSIAGGVDLGHGTRFFSTLMILTLEFGHLLLSFQSSLSLMTGSNNAGN